MHSVMLLLVAVSSNGESIVLGTGTACWVIATKSVTRLDAAIVSATKQQARPKPAVQKTVCRDVRCLWIVQGLSGYFLVMVVGSARNRFVLVCVITPPAVMEVAITKTGRAVQAVLVIA